MKRASIRSVIEHPHPDKYYYVLVTRYYPRYLRMHGLKLSDTPIAVWDRDLAPSKELLKDYKLGKISWKEYEERFRREAPKDFVKRRLEEYQRKAQGREVVLVCIEEDWQFPFCHTWILLDIWKHDPDGLEPEKPSGKRVLIKGFDTEKEAREWIKTEKLLAKKLGKKPHYYEVEKAVSPLGTEVWYVYQILEKKHWLFPDLSEKPKKPLRATLEPWIEAARVKPLEEFMKLKPEEKSETVEEWLESKGWKPLAVGADFKPTKECVISLSRPPSTDPASLGRIMKLIDEGEGDYSRKALVWMKKTTYTIL